MELKLFFGIAAGLLFVIGNSSYAKDTWDRKIAPQRTTWLIYTVVGFIGFTNQFVSDAGYGSIPYAFATASMLIVFLMSLKFGIGGYEKLDITILFVTGVGILGWLLLNNPSTSILACGVAIIVSSSATLIKIFRDPHSENYTLWTISSIGLLLNILALEQYAFTTLCMPLLWLANNSLIITLQFVLRSDNRPREGMGNTRLVWSSNHVKSHSAASPRASASAG